MMIDFSDDGLPEDNLHFATDGHSDGIISFNLPNGKTIHAEQATAGEGLGTGVVTWQSATALALHNQLLRESYDLISLVARAPCHLMIMQATPWHKLLQIGAMDQVRYKLACSCRRLRERVQEDRSRGAQLVAGWS